MDVEDGELYIKHLASFVRTHERALANSLQSRPSTAPSQNGRQGSITSNASTLRDGSSPPSSSSSLFSLSTLGLASRPIKAAKLFLTPNQLYFLLSRFEELGVSVGAMNIRLEDILSESTSSNYMSFLTEPKVSARRGSDQESIRSISSVRSVMSTMSSMWSRFSIADRASAKAEKQKAALLEDLRYLYSAFTKIPCLKLATDHRIRRIAGYEEFPFDTAVPLYVFKNVTVLEITDVDFRSFHGWDRMADQLRSLTVKRANLDDPTDLLTNIVLDDVEGRRWRSSKNCSSPIPAASPSPRARYAELAHQSSGSESPFTSHRRQSVDTDNIGSYGAGKANRRQRMRSISPSRPSPGRKGGILAHKGRPRARRSSDSSNSTGAPSTPRTSSSNLLLSAGLPYTKWRFLRHLSLSDNSLTNLSAHSLAPLAPTLQSLDLSSNLFTDVPECLATLTSLRSLSLSNCMIESLRSLLKSPLPAISVLSLRGNRLKDLVGVERLLSLERIDVRDNQLKDPVELARLTGIPGVRDVYVSRNPFTRLYPNFRITIFNLFRAIPGRVEELSLDGVEPTSKERRELADRAPDMPPVAVLAPGFKEDEAASMLMPPPPAPARETPTPDSRNEENQQPLTASQPRSRTPKRRVVNVDGQSSPKAKKTNDDSGAVKTDGSASNNVSPPAFVVSSKAPGSRQSTPTRPLSTGQKLAADRHNARYKLTHDVSEAEHSEHWLKYTSEGPSMAAGGGMKANAMVSVDG